MNYIAKSTLCIALVCFPVAMGCSNTYYVSTTGSPSSLDCSEVTPCATIEQALAIGKYSTTSCSIDILVNGTITGSGNTGILLDAAPTALVIAGLPSSNPTIDCAGTFFLDVIQDSGLPSELEQTSIDIINLTVKNGVGSGRHRNRTASVSSPVQSILVFESHFDTSQDPCPSTGRAMHVGIHDVSFVDNSILGIPGSHEQSAGLLRAACGVQLQLSQVDFATTGPPGNFHSISVVSAFVDAVNLSFSSSQYRMYDFICHGCQGSVSYSDFSNGGWQVLTILPHALTTRLQLADSTLGSIYIDDWTDGEVTFAGNNIVEGTYMTLIDDGHLNVTNIGTLEVQASNWCLQSAHWATGTPVLHQAPSAVLTLATQPYDSLPSLGAVEIEGKIQVDCALSSLDFPSSWELSGEIALCPGHDVTLDSTQIICGV